MADEKKPSKPPGRKIRVDLRKNREKPPRKKREWTRLFREEDIAQEDAEQEERVRAKGRLSRKRTVVIRDEAPDGRSWRSGTVVAARGLIAEVDDGERTWACTVRRLLRTRLIKERHPITVGDAVRFEPVELAGQGSVAVSEARSLPEGVIREVAQRQTALVRRYEQRLQVVAANVELALIVIASDQPPLRPHLIDRYLVAIHQGGMRPAVCINKADLDKTGLGAAVVKRYEDLGYRSVLTCALDGRGLDALREMLAGQTSVLVGPSGVGKSCLLNALDPGLSLKVGALSDLQRGRHTTTTTRLLRWAFGGFVVDTPGMRQFDPADVAPEELEAYFTEFVDRVASCKFADCSHTHEIGCAVKEAVEAGEVLGERYDSYCKMYEECAEKRQF